MARHIERDIQWHNAQDWLYATGKLSHPSNELLNFAMTLVDGVVLCEVANYLQPGAIKSFNYRPSLQFRRVMNIDNFLNACIRVFGFDSHELFTATELLEIENFGKVVEVLAKLSQTEHSKRHGISPFFCNYSEDQEVYTTLEREAESRSEDIYSMIEDLHQLDHTTEFSYQDAYQHESIYEDIVQIKQYRMDKPSDKRGYLIDEIFETEKNYVQMLETIIDNFLEKLKPILNHHDIKIVFQNIEELKKIHEKLLQRVKLSIDNSGTTIGECFVKTVDQFYTYGNYCACLDLACQKIDDLLEDSKITNVINRCLVESQQRFSLKDLLKVPAQRILKYHLLLDSLGKAQPLNIGLQEGCKVMKTLASYVNEYKRNYEQMLQTRSIEEKIINKDMENLYSYGKLLKDGEITLKHGNRSVKRFAFLFERCVLICKKLDNSTLEIQVLLDFETYDISERYDMPGGSKFSYGWCMKNNVDILQSPYQIMVKTYEQCAVWLAKLDEGYSLLTSPPHLKWDHIFSLSDFDTPVNCSSCGERLSGVFAQGIHCSICEWSGHRTCKSQIGECKKPRMSRGASYNTKELPSIPAAQPRSMSEAHIFTQMDGGSGPNAPSPPPIPPRVPSMKVGRGSMPTTPIVSTRAPSFSDRGTTSPQQFTIQGDLYVCTRDYSGAAIGEGFEPTIALDIGEFVEVTKKDHPMYWKGKSQSSGFIGYFPSDNVKMYSQTRTNSITTPIMPASPSYQPSMLYNYPWYVGEMDRNGGRMMLEPATVPDGCYLVRESKTRPGQYSIDVKFNFLVKHIKVVYSGETRTYCLAPSKTFNSIVELVTHYQHSTLGQVFRDLQTKLLVPYRCLPGS